MHPAETRVSMLCEAIRQYASAIRAVEDAQVQRGRAYDRLCKLVTTCEATPLDAAKAALDNKAATEQLTREVIMAVRRWGVPIECEDALRAAITGVRT